MIKITLINNTQIEFDSPKEASQFLHSLYWREFLSKKPEVTDNNIPKNVKGFCKVCSGPILKGSGKQVLCGSVKCANKYKAAYQRKWHKQHPKQNPEIVPISNNQPPLVTA